MGRFFITGSSDGLGSLTAKRLVAQGHKVVLHARSEQRAADAAAACPGAEAVLVADLSSINETKKLAAEADKLGPYDGVMHNAGLYLGYEKVPGRSGLPSLFTVNTVAPYVLTCLMSKPRRLVFVSSGLHRAGQPRLDDLPGSGYNDSKLQDIMLARAFARRWPGVESNAVDPGWVPTKMGGSGATGKLDDAVDTFVMATLGEGAASGKTGTYFARSRVDKHASVADDIGLQERLLEELGKISGVSVPE
ncbi:Short-chain dehydrogenase [Pleurostoma richardsiae]|uniref:Short-chain dehydrogenase n=1 Tax=Pleurostoma richardsiae TaxID=41990 RepID=A0AA38R5I1_9PEZI|nr:Short-chain dehydrogenase [Pleurostoma richardsiae]